MMGPSSAFAVSVDNLQASPGSQSNGSHLDKPSRTDGASLHCPREGESQSPSLGEHSPPTTAKIQVILLPGSQAIWDLLSLETATM